MNASLPLRRLADTIERARAASPADPTAATLATADSQGRPSARIVLVKGVDSRGMTFFTNRDSRKGHELSSNPWAALCFYWPLLLEQVRAEGPTEELPDSESDSYFATRPRPSQLGAWASHQSESVPSRGVLEEALRDAERRFAGGPVPRPPRWGGYLLRPRRLEFWRQGEGRLHHRELFSREGDEWRITLLQP